MKCRKVVWNEVNKKYDIVWFGSQGLAPVDPENSDAPLKKISADNYSIEQEGVAHSLIQRLSVIRGELWYQINYGLPLFEKIKNKGILDSLIMGTITDHPEVRSVGDFSSVVEKSKYSISVKIDTIYNESISFESTFGI